MLDRLMERLNTLSEIKKDLLSLLALLLLCTLLFSNVLFTDDVLVSESLDRYYPWKYYRASQWQEKALNRMSDVILQEWPQRLVAARIVRNGDLPLWSPYYLSGVPLLATLPSKGLFYPFNMIFYLMDPPTALGYASLAQLFLAGTFMYFYLRTLELRAFVCLLGAVTFGLGGYFLPHLSQSGRVNTGIWIGLMFLSVEKLFRGKRWIWTVGLGIAIGMAGLAGHFGVVAYELLALGLYSAWRLPWAVRNQGGRKATQSAFLVVGGVILGASLCAVQLIPTYDASRFVKRAHLPYEARLSHGRSVQTLAMALVPDIFGNPVDSPPWDSHQFGGLLPEHYASSSTYAGVLPLSLAIWALLVRRSRLSFFFAFLAILSIGIFLDTVVFRLLYLLPIFRLGRQVEARIIYAFAISVLSALGLDSLLDLAGESHNRLIRRGSVALLVIAVATVMMVALGGIVVYSKGSGDLGLAGRWYTYNIGNLLRFAILVFGCSMFLFSLSRCTWKPHLFGSLAMILVVGDLFYFGWKFNPPQDPGNLYAETAGIRFLQDDPDIFRIIRGPGGKKTLPSNTPAVYDLTDAQGFMPLLLDRYADFMNLVEDGISEVRGIHSLRQPESVSSRLLDLLNVKYILSRPEARADLTHFVESDANVELVYQGDVTIYENKDVLPRAFVVTDYLVLEDSEEILAELTNEEFDPGERVILEQEPELEYTSSVASVGESHANILEYAPDSVMIEVEMLDDGFLVVSDVYYDGWKAIVDGEERRIHRADYIFRAVELQEGRHIVEFVFDPLPFKVGAGISTVAVAFSVSLSTYWLLKECRFAGDWQIGELLG